jgi:tryptophan-rich sensory protein
MAGIASKSQLRMSFLRYALFTVPGVLLLGTLSGALAGAGSGNAWFAALHKPPVMPPGWVFGAVWSFIYILLGVSLAMLLHAQGAVKRKRALWMFALLLVLTFAWPFAFFALHKLTLALSLIAAMMVLAIALVFQLWRVRMLAALLLYPFIGWLMFAGALDYQLIGMNPDAATLAPQGASTDIPL